MRRMYLKDFLIVIRQDRRDVEKSKQYEKLRKDPAAELELVRIGVYLPVTAVDGRCGYEYR